MKNTEPEEESGGYSWMDTYGDLVTLLLCFFVLLYSFSTLNEQKAQELVSSFSGTYGAAAIQAFDISEVKEDAIRIDSMVDFESRGSQQQGDVSDSELQEMQELQEQINETFDELYQKIVSYIEINELSGQMSVSRTDDVIILRFNEIALFDSGSATIRPESAETLKHFIQIITENIDSISMVNIEGHTDTVPIHTAEFEDNWDLSVKRATNTLRILLDAALIEETKLSAIGYGEHQPIAPNETPEGRAENRRVDFVLNKVKVTVTAN
jgi:chemotaxis protein MotB